MKPSEFDDCSEYDRAWMIATVRAEETMAAWETQGK